MIGTPGRHVPSVMKNLSLTSHEAATLRTVLSTGGRCIQTQSTLLTRRHIRTVTISRLWKKGYVKCWSNPAHMPWARDIYVTAAGCNALRDFELAQIKD